jgi:hypothetical protein
MTGKDRIELVRLRNHIAYLLSAILISSVLICAQSTQSSTEPTQETIDRRVDEIVKVALKRGVIILPDGTRATPMGANTSLTEMQEIQKFGERAIAPLSKYLDSPSRRAQTLATNLLVAIDGKAVIKPLSYAAERCSSSVARTAALESLKRQDWRDVAEVVERVSINDPDPQVKKIAQEIVAKHQGN